MSTTTRERLRVATDLLGLQNRFFQEAWEVFEREGIDEAGSIRAMVHLGVASDAWENWLSEWEE